MHTAELSEEVPFLDFAQVKDCHNSIYSRFLSACQCDDVEVAFQLVPDQEDAVLTCGFNRALEYAHWNLARQLLDYGARWDYATLIVASKSSDAIKLLIDSGFNVNTNGGVLLRHTIAYQRSSRVVQVNDEASIRLLLEHGAKASYGSLRYSEGGYLKYKLHDKSGAILSRAAARCTPEIFSLLLEHGAVLSDCIALHQAAGVHNRIPRGERIPMLEYLYGLGLDVNAMDDAIKRSHDTRGQLGTPLHYAINSGRVEEARWLLEHGADPDNEVHWKTPRQCVIDKNYPEGHEMKILFAKNWPKKK